MSVWYLPGKLPLVVVRAILSSVSCSTSENIVLIFVKTAGNAVGIIDRRALIFFADKVDRVGGFDLTNHRIQRACAVADKVTCQREAAVAIGVCFRLPAESSRRCWKAPTVPLLYHDWHKHAGGFRGAGRPVTVVTFLVIAVVQQSASWHRPPVRHHCDP